MARITPQQRQRYGPLLTGSVPGAVLGAIDDQELEDRLSQAAGLMQQVAKAATPGAGRQAGEQARRILAARPRAETEQIVVAKMAKARRLGDSPQAAALERQARNELLDHPPAVRRNATPVAKAKAATPDEDLMAIYDQAGNLTHVGRRKDLTPVLPQPGTQAKRTTPVKAGGTTDIGQPGRAAPAAEPGDVPDRQVIKSMGAEWIEFRDWTGTLAGAVKRSDVTPLPHGQVLKGAAAASRANVYDAARQRIGTAALADIIPLARLRATRRAGR
jgi:hypothetical protein